MMDINTAFMWGGSWWLAGVVLGLGFGFLVNVPFLVKQYFCRGINVSAMS